MNILSFIALAALTATSLPAQEAPPQILDDAQAIMFSSCLQNKAHSISECSCYSKAIKERMPKTDYHFFMEALYYSNEGDKIGFDKIMKKYNKRLEDLDVMSKQVTGIGTKVEAECNLDKKISLPNPKQR